MPSLIIVGGPNGSGKTTLTKYLIQKGRINCPVINPDEIAFDELGGYQFQIGAARIALSRRRQAIYKKEDIAFETTLSGNSEITESIAAKALGYQIILYYVALQSPLDNIIRVEQRQANAGHSVERGDIIRRHENSKLNLISNIKLFDTVYLFDNSEENRSRVAIFKKGELRWVNAKHKEHPFFKDLIVNPPPTPPQLQD